MGSPTKRTVSVARVGRSTAGAGPPRLGRPGKSAANSAATTPGTRSAPETSTLRSRAWGSTLRTNAMVRAPGSCRLSTYVPRPVSRLGSSLRTTAAPTIDAIAFLLAPRVGPRPGPTPPILAHPSAASKPLCKGHRAGGWRPPPTVCDSAEVDGGAWLGLVGGPSPVGHHRRGCGGPGSAGPRGDRGEAAAPARGARGGDHDR